jgi:hypothetical protein
MFKSVQKARVTLKLAFETCGSSARKWKRYKSVKGPVVSDLHGVTTQKIILFSGTALGASNPTQEPYLLSVGFAVKCLVT